jgi:hypothetical protein
MIHFCRAIGALMLDVAAAAVLNIGVKSRRLLAKLNRARGMTSGTRIGFNASCWDVAPLALTAEEGMPTTKARARIGVSIQESLPSLSDKDRRSSFPRSAARQ